MSRAQIIPMTSTQPDPVFKGRVVRWIEHRLPVFAFLYRELHAYPTPKNLSYWWNFGSPAGITVVIMIVTGITLAMPLYAGRQYSLRQRRAHHARRQLRMADPLPAYDRGVHAVCPGLSAYVPWPLLWILQGATGACGRQRAERARRMAPLASRTLRTNVKDREERDGVCRIRKACMNAALSYDEPHTPAPAQAKSAGCRAARGSFPKRKTVDVPRSV
jgi:hypothetical protein